MSTATSTVSGNESTVVESGFLGRVQAPSPVSHTHVAAAGTYDMSPRGRKIVYLYPTGRCLVSWERRSLGLVRLFSMAKYSVAPSALR